MPKRRVRKHLIDVEGLNVEISFKSIKTIRLKVCPPDGMVKVSAPYHIAINDIASLVVNKRAWIDDQKVRIKASSGHQVLSFVTGEQHRVFGKNYVLAVKESGCKNRVECDHMSSTLTMFTKEDSVQGRSRLMDAWYKSELQQKIPGFIKQWEPVVGKSIREWRLRKMKTRWGSCNILKRRIWLNSELAKYPESCLEYVVVHELTHLHERYHNANFYRLMDSYLPGWRLQKQILDEEKY